jgi:hypothetical protein
VREVPGGYPDPAGFREALEGVGTLFLVSAEEARDRRGLPRPGERRCRGGHRPPPMTPEQTLDAHPELLSGDLPG